MKSKLFDLLKACKTSQFESAAEDLADALWLMQVIDQKKSKTPQPISTDQVKEEFKDPLSHPDATHSSSPSPANIETKPPPEKSTSKSTNQLDLHIPKQERSSVGFIKTPVPDSLPHKQEIRRAFSILRKAFVAGFSQEVDEERTTKRISDELIWEPIMQLSKERNLNLALVVDQSISMIVWQDTAKEFHKLLATLGAFRKITPWKIETEKEEPILSLGLSYSKKRRARKISELLTTSEKQIVIILTDSISAAWHNGNMAKVVDVWSKTNQVAIINFLPEFLWSRTGLNRAKKVLLSAPYQIALNANLKCSEIDFLSTTDLKNLDKQLFSSPIPVATIAPYSLTSLSRLVVGYGNSQVLGFFLKKKVESVPKTVIGSSLSPEEVVKRFHSLVSPAARQLARYLAASPVINLQIVRILRSKMISHSFEAGTITEAEVLLNGLFKVSESITETTPSKIEFEFREGVREYLLAALTLTDVIQVLEEVSDYITEHLGNLDLETFKLMLTNPGKALEEIEGKSLDKIVATSPVARITADILHRLGGNYTKLAKTLTETPTIP
ncbi:MAG: hypothetical protein JNN15_15380, partial [Blastocatellia bacterium]|nr:hypothetical protein [Blastocatellia bacterium]